jgi:hypothetical protein
VDVDSLFITHAVTDSSVTADGDPTCTWLHTHGLAEVGGMDFDVIRPSPTITGRGYDTIRALAYTILEKGPSVAGQTMSVFHPGGTVMLVPVEEFNRSASASDRAPRGDPSDATHNRHRVVLCEPGGKRLFGLLGAATRASRAFQAADGEHMMAHFSNSATNLMAERARKTVHLFQQFTEEFAEFEAKPIAKIGYTVDGGSDDEREHMWFEVHGFGNGTLDATLLNSPFNIARMKEGDRGTHGVDHLTDWTVMTPLGSITPRDMGIARRIRANTDKVRAAFAEFKKQRNG